MVSDTLDGEIVEARHRLSDRVRSQTRQFSAGATLLDILLSPLWALGWVVFWVVLLLAETGRLGFAAIRLGWMDARDRAAARRIAVERWPVRPRAPKKAPGGPR